MNGKNFANIFMHSPLIKMTKGNCNPIQKYRVHIRLYFKHTPGDFTYLIDSDHLLIMKILYQEILNLLLHFIKCVISRIKILYRMLH
jgi:hypothetical protein